MAIFADTYAFGLKESYSAYPSDLDNLHEYASENADIRAFKEAHADMVSIVESMVEFDLQELQMTKEAMDTGRDVESLYAVYEGAFTQKVKEIFGKIKKFLQDLWAKIKQVIKTIGAAIMALFLSGKKFVAKYSKELDAVKGKKVRVKAYKFQNIKALKVNDKTFNVEDNFPDIKRLGKIVEGLKSEVKISGDLKEGLASDFKKQMEAMRDAKEETLDEVRADFLDKSGRVTSDRFAEEVFAYFREGSGTIYEYDYKVADAIALLKADNGSTVKTYESKTDSAFKDVIRKIDQVAKDAEALADKDAPASLREALAGYARELSSFIAATQSIGQQIFKAWSSAIKQAEALAKTVCVRAIGGKGEK